MSSRPARVLDLTTVKRLERAIPFDPLLKQQKEREREAAEALAAAAAATPMVDVPPGSGGSAGIVPVKSTPADAPKVAPAVTDRQQNLRDALDMCLTEQEKETVNIAGKKYEPSDPISDAQNVFPVDFFNAAQVVHYNYDRAWPEVLMLGVGEDKGRVRSYYFPWPGPLQLYAEEIPKVKLKFTAAGVRLSEALRQNDTDDGFTGVDMHIPFGSLKDALSDMAEAEISDAYHVIPFGADLLSYSTENVPFFSNAALISYAHDYKKGTKSLIHDYRTEKVVTAGGVARGLLLAPDTHSGEFSLHASTKKSHQPHQLFRANFDLLMDAWMSRIMLKNFDAFKTHLLANFQHPRVSGILRIPAPSLSGKGLTEAAWWILTFFPFFQLALYDWHASASEEEKKLVLQQAVVADIQGDFSEDIKFHLHVPASAYMQLLDFFRVKYHPVRYASRYTRGIGLAFENTNDEATNAKLLEDIAKTGRDPLLTKVYAVVHLGYLAVRSFKAHHKNMPRPDAEYVQMVDGRACLCKQREKKQDRAQAVEQAKQSTISVAATTAEKPPTVAEVVAGAAVDPRAHMHGGGKLKGTFSSGKKC